MTKFEYAEDDVSRLRMTVRYGDNSEEGRRQQQQRHINRYDGAGYESFPVHLYRGLGQFGGKDKEAHTRSSSVAFSVPGSSKSACETSEQPYISSNGTASEYESDEQNESKDSVGREMEKKPSEVEERSKSLEDILSEEKASEERKEQKESTDSLEEEKKKLMLEEEDLRKRFEAFQIRKKAIEDLESKGDCSGGIVAVEDDNKKELQRSTSEIKAGVSKQEMGRSKSVQQGRTRIEGSGNETPAPLCAPALNKLSTFNIFTKKKR